MAVKRIVANMNVADPAQAKRFYGEILGLELQMDMGWIQTYGSNQNMKLQLSLPHKEALVRLFQTFQSKLMISRKPMGDS